MGDAWRPGIHRDLHLVLWHGANMECPVLRISYLFHEESIIAHYVVVAVPYLLSKKYKICYILQRLYRGMAEKLQMSIELQ